MLNTRQENKEKKKLYAYELALQLQNEEDAVKRPVQQEVKPEVKV